VAYYTSFIVREDAQELFGFETWDERCTFELLIGLNKVGARTASAILSVFRPDDLRRVVYEDDPTPLTRVSGIGKKSAQQIFLELKYKLKVDDCPVLSSNTAGVIAGSVFRDALSGLAPLGFKEAEGTPLLKKILHDEPDLDAAGAIRAVLKQVARAAQEKA
jgi:Holliday junction DNA helicase RuvA